MSRSLSGAAAAHILETVTTLVHMLRVQRVDGTLYGFTNHNDDISVGGVTYLARTALDRTAVQANTDLTVPSLDMFGGVDSVVVVPADIRAGLWDGAQFRFFLVNWQAPTEFEIDILAGYIGKITQKGIGFSGECRGLMSRLTQNIGELYSPDCRADLGDARCKVPLSYFGDGGTVTSVIDNRTFQVSGISEAKPFLGGRFTWLTGNNAGEIGEIKQYGTGGSPTVPQIALFLPATRTVQVGDTFTAFPGCDKKFTTCKNVYNNVANFRGEPDVPGEDILITTVDPISVSNPEPGNLTPFPNAPSQ